MKLITTTAIALVAAGAASAAQAQTNYGGQNQPQTQMPQAQSNSSAPASQQKQIKVSGKAAKAISELQKAVNDNDAANIPAKVAAAQAVASTADDRYAIGQLQLKAAITAKDNAAAASAVDAIAASGFLPAAQVAELYNAVGVQLYNAKQYDQAAALFQKAATADAANAEAVKLLAEAYNAGGKRAEGAAALARAIQLASASGQKPAEELYKRAVGMAYEAKSPNAVELGRQWVAAYPSGDSWKNAIAIYRNFNHPGVGPTLDLLRLMRAANALISPGDYALYATAAADQGNFAEAQSVLDQGIAAKVVDPSNATFRDIVAGLKTKPKATAADLAAAAKTAPAATTLLGIGDRYYGLGDYQNAVSTYKAAMAKGADANLANLHIGMALARAGDKAGATTALNAVQGPNAEIARYWLLFVQRG